MSADLIFFYTGKVFWLVFAIATLFACVTASICAVVGAAKKTFDGAATWLGSRYVLDRQNKDEIMEKMAQYHRSYGIPAERLNDWLAAVWKNRDRIDEKSQK